MTTMQMAGMTPGDDDPRPQMGLVVFVLAAMLLAFAAFLALVRACFQ